jgi:hypothetical protein
MMPRVLSTERMTRSLRRHATPTTPISWIDQLEKDAGVILGGQAAAQVEVLEPREQLWDFVQMPSRRNSEARDLSAADEKQDAAAYPAHGAALQEQSDALYLYSPDLKARTSHSHKMAAHPQRPETPPARRYFDRAIAGTSDMYMRADRRPLRPAARPGTVHFDPALDPYHAASHAERMASPAHARLVGIEAGSRPAALVRRSAPSPPMQPTRAFTAPRVAPTTPAPDASHGSLNAAVYGASAPRVLVRVPAPAPGPGSAEFPEASHVQARPPPLVISAPTDAAQYATSVRFAIPGPPPASPSAALQRVLSDGFFVDGQGEAHEVLDDAAAVLAAASAGATLWVRPERDDEADPEAELLYLPQQSSGLGRYNVHAATRLSRSIRRGQASRSISPQRWTAPQTMARSVFHR